MLISFYIWSVFLYFFSTLSLSFFLLFHLSLFPSVSLFLSLHVSLSLSLSLSLCLYLCLCLSLSLSLSLPLSILSIFLFLSSPLEGSQLYSSEKEPACVPVVLTNILGTRTYAMAIKFTRPFFIEKVSDSGPVRI